MVDLNTVDGRLFLRLRPLLLDALAQQDPDVRDRLETAIVEEPGALGVELDDDSGEVWVTVSVRVGDEWHRLLSAPAERLGLSSADLDGFE